MAHHFGVFAAWCASSAYFPQPAADAARLATRNSFPLSLRLQRSQYTNRSNQPWSKHTPNAEIRIIFPPVQKNSPIFVTTAPERPLKKI
jgi:hypothetical protein